MKAKDSRTIQEIYDTLADAWNAWLKAEKAWLKAEKAWLNAVVSYMHASNKGKVKLKVSNNVKTTEEAWVKANDVRVKASEAWVLADYALAEIDKALHEAKSLTNTQTP